MDFLQNAAQVGINSLRLPQSGEVVKLVGVVVHLHSAFGTEHL